MVRIRAVNWLDVFGYSTGLSNITASAGISVLYLRSFLFVILGYL
jgi:hypothetical protein